MPTKEDIVAIALLRPYVCGGLDWVDPNTPRSVSCPVKDGVASLPTWATLVTTVEHVSVTPLPPLIQCDGGPMFHQVRLDPKPPDGGLQCILEYATLSASPTASALIGAVERALADAGSSKVSSKSIEDFHVTYRDIGGDDPIRTVIDLYRPIIDQFSLCPNGGLPLMTMPTPMLDPPYWQQNVYDTPHIQAGSWESCYTPFTWPLSPRDGEDQDSGGLGDSEATAGLTGGGDGAPPDMDPFEAFPSAVEKADIQQYGTVGKDPRIVASDTPIIVKDRSSLATAETYDSRDSTLRVHISAAGLPQRYRDDPQLLVGLILTRQATPDVHYRIVGTSKGTDYTRGDNTFISANITVYGASNV